MNIRNALEVEVLEHRKLRHRMAYMRKQLTIVSRARLVADPAH